ncbi:hypothetical protein H6P81_019749 [Aristolochia fimbriata]|uniref:Pectinesterase catalytic domain-containing protein n=1 Tax=Aristolochia fimbriata TaxID=158543 RepID=A0AAV7DUE1_ARIFI|nr:hypothetical protein H6P81_019749 [Aristolochia fimbriata]
MAFAFYTLFNYLFLPLLLLSVSQSLFLQKYHVVKAEKNIIAREGEYSGDHGTDKKPGGIGVRAGISKWNANVVVARDGSGNYRSIQEAVDRAPSNISSWRYVIYIKEGWYHENVVVEPHKTNLAFVGDGKSRSTINSNRGSPEFNIHESGALAPDQIFKNERWSTFREYANKGKGADTSRRVRWPSYKVVYNPAEVDRYTVAKLINGNEWLPALGIPYKAGL